jgi:hypothetical protein
MDEFSVLHFYAAPASGKVFDAASTAPAPSLLNSKSKFVNLTEVKTNITNIFPPLILYYLICYRVVD